MLLSALAALLLSGPPAALAEDPAPAPQYDERDANQDGEVSGKERRRARRADRRARRGQKNADGTAAVDEEQDAADADAADARGQAASRAAANAASALKSSMPSLDAAAMPGGGDGKAPGGAGAAGAGDGKAAAAEFHAGGAAGAGGGFKTSGFSSGASGDPSKPRAPSDYVLAARSGYAPAFAKSGLKLSADGRSVVRADGSPATAEDYARLQREIGSMPGAVSRRADFFNAISPGHYADLKRDYKTKKDEPAFKDVGTTEGDRDFVHTATCDKLSGGCNENVEKGSYKKGDYVAPEDLDAIWGALQKQIDGSSAAEGGMSLSEKSASLARDKAVEAAEALTDDPKSPGGVPGKKEASTASATSSPAAVAEAVAAAQKFFASVKGLALPGRDPKTGEGGNPLPLIAGGALAALGLGVLILRRKG